jgi:hypothetical protein
MDIVKFPQDQGYCYLTQSNNNKQHQTESKKDIFSHLYQINHSSNKIDLIRVNYYFDLQSEFLINFIILIL